MTIATNVGAFKCEKKKKIKEGRIPIEWKFPAPAIRMRLLVGSSGKTRVREWMREKSRLVVSAVWGHTRFPVSRAVREEFVWADPDSLDPCDRFCRFRHNARRAGFRALEFVVGS